MYQVPSATPTTAHVGERRITRQSGLLYRMPSSRRLHALHKVSRRIQIDAWILRFVPQDERRVRSDPDSPSAVFAWSMLERWLRRASLLTHALAPIIVVATVGMAQAILSAAGLSFLGLGAQAHAGVGSDAQCGTILSV